MDIEQELRQKVEEARKEQELQDNEEIQQREEPQEELQEPEEEVEESPDEYEEEVEEVEQEPEDELDDEPVDKKDKYAAKKFAMMRKENKAKEQELQEMRERLARVEGMQQAKIEPVEEVVKEEVPDRDEDPDAYFDYQLRQKDKAIDKINQKLESYEQQTTLTKAEQVYQDMENKYVEKNPVYKEAKSYLIDTLKTELRQANPTATEAQISNHIKDQEYKLVGSLAGQGWGEAAIFNAIKAQAEDKGFVAKKVRPKNNDKLKRNMDKAASLNDAPAASGEMGFSENQLARMKQADFNKIVGNKDQMTKMHDALKKARLKAMG